jgi:ligand-binding SRPBCC domain-containing protein
VITIVIKSKIKSNENIKRNGACKCHGRGVLEIFSSPSNLQKITPETMGFQITDFDSKPMYAGQIIQYKVTPLLGIISWMTEISFVKENSYFVDEQRLGPMLYGITNILKRLRTVLK